jgi:tetratricopeptide (TPR) repeat protein
VRAVVGWQRAETAGQRFSDLADQLGQPTLRFFATFTAASLALVAGNLSVAETMAEDAFQIGNDAGEPDAILVYGAQLSNIRTWQGRGEEIIGMLEETVAAFPGLSGLRAGLAWTYCWCDRREKAAAIVEQAASDGFDHVPWDLGRSIALAAYADAASQAGVKSTAPLLYDLIAPWSDQVTWNGGPSLGHNRTYLGLLASTLGWEERADEHFSLACRLQEEKGMLLGAARAHLGWAEALADRGEAERASAEATRALELSHEHGYGVIGPRAAALVETGSVTQR